MDCVITKRNLGESQCQGLPALPKAMITTPNDFKLLPADYATEAALKTALQNLLVAPINSRGYLWPLFSAVEVASEDAGYEDGAFGRTPVRDGQYRFNFGISKNLCLHKAAFSHRAVNQGRALIIDVDNQLWTTEDSAANAYGLTVALLHTEKLKISDGSSITTKSPIIVDLADNEELDKYGKLIGMGRVLGQLTRLTDVSITLADGDAFDVAGFKVDVKRTCDGLPVSGILVADFFMTQNDDITAQNIVSAAPDANVAGRYNILPTTAFVDGFLTLRAAAALTVKAYEVYERLTVNV